MQEASAYRLKAGKEARSMSMLVPACTVIDSAFAARLAVDPCTVGICHVQAVNLHVPCSQNVRVLVQNEYAVLLIHHIRPLNRQETHQFLHFRHPRFRPGQVSDRASTSIAPLSSAAAAVCPTGWGAAAFDRSGMASNAVIGEHSSWCEAVG